MPIGIQSLNNAPTLRRIKEKAERRLRPESTGPMDPVKHVKGQSVLQV
jgi:hypothetical protein